MEKVDQSADHGPETPPKKRAREAEDDADDELEGLSREELAKMSRSERKRHREKKRRSDVNKGFDELTTLLLEIDPTVRAEAEERARRGQWKGNFGAQEDNLLSRVDLISRAVDVLRRVHSENEERKQIIASLSQPPGAGGSNLGFESAGAAVGASGGSQGRDRAAAMIDEAAMMGPASLGLAMNNTGDAYALRAAAESSQFYNQSLLDRLSSARSTSMASLSPYDNRGLSVLESLSLRSSRDLRGFGGGADLGRGDASSDALLTGQASLFASGLAGIPNLMNPGVVSSGSTALTRHYLRLLQDRQNATNLLTGARAHGDGGSSQYHGSGGDRRGHHEDTSRK